MAINDGGYAFPYPALANEGFSPQYDMGGMSLRAYFAGLAMQGIIAGKASNENMWCDEEAAITARQAVERADALIAELAKGASDE